MTQKIDKAKTLELMLSAEGVSFHTDREWSTLAEHVDVHKYLLGKKLGMPISWDEALFSWYETIYTPLKREISTGKMRRNFKDRTSGELYLALSDHWFYFKEKYPETNAFNASASFLALNKPEKHGFFSSLFRIFSDTENSRAGEKGKQAA